MKKLRFLFLVVFLASITSFNSWGQLIRRETIVTLTEPGIDYGSPIGTVTGTYKYNFTIKLSKEGFIESFHWRGSDWNLVNDKGELVKIIDSGHDTYGLGWDFFNNKDYYNTGWNITYDIPDGWMNEWWPALMPLEGTNVNMSLKILCKGKIIDWSNMVQLHINANGEITANVVKP